MKKLLTSLMATTVLVSSASSAISCGKKYKGWMDVYLVTDAGKINDKSFNESGYNAGNEIMNLLGINDNLDKKYDGIGYSEPKDEQEFDNRYKIAKSAGAKTLILPGYKHGGERLKKASELIDDVVIIDNSNENHNNVTGLLFRADISAFYSGFASIIYSLATENYNKAGNGKLVLATFGGSPNGFAVDNFMHGFLASINFYNEFKKDEENKKYIEEMIKAINPNLKDGSLEKLLNVEVSRANSQNEGIAIDQSNYFSGSFLAGSGQGISDKLVNTDKANVVLPVAGPQTGDLLNVIKKRKASTKVIGVDTDQIKVYPQFNDQFITSAEKDIVSSTVLAISHLEKYNKNENFFNKVLEKYKDIGVTEEKDGKFVDVNLADKKTWSGTTKWLGGKISYDNGNKVNKNLYDLIMKLFKNGEKVIGSSKYYFSELANKGIDVTLSADKIKGYASKILEELKK